LLLYKLLYFLKNNATSLRLALQEVLLNKGYRKFSRLIADAYLMRDISSSDIIHCQFSTLAPRILQLKNLGFIDKQPKIVCSIRGYDITNHSYTKSSYWQTLFSGIDTFIPVCQNFESLLRNMGCEKPISVVHSPINVRHIKSSPDIRLLQNPVRLVSIGRLVEKKGIIDALTALLLLKKKGLVFHYSIIGDGKLRQSLIDYVNAQKLEECVEFMGSLPSDRTLSILDTSDILIAPSKTAADGNNEGIPNVLKEAMLMGLQVISTTHSGIPELIEHKKNGYLCAENDPEGLAKVIEFVAGNSQQWLDIAKHAAATVMAEYTPEKTTEDLIEAYRAALS